MGLRKNVGVAQTAAGRDQSPTDRRCQRRVAHALDGIGHRHKLAAAHSGAGVTLCNRLGQAGTGKADQNVVVFHQRTDVFGRAVNDGGAGRGGFQDDLDGFVNFVAAVTPHQQGKFHLALAHRKGDQARGAVAIGAQRIQTAHPHVDAWVGVVGHDQRAPDKVTGVDAGDTRYFPVHDAGLVQVAAAGERVDNVLVPVVAHVFGVFRRTGRDGNLGVVVLHHHRLAGRQQCAAVAELDHKGFGGFLQAFALQGDGLGHCGRTRCKRHSTSDGTHKVGGAGGQVSVNGDTFGCPVQGSGGAAARANKGEGELPVLVALQDGAHSGRHAIANVVSNQGVDRVLRRECGRIGGGQA